MSTTDYEKSEPARQARLRSYLGMGLVMFWQDVAAIMALQLLMLWLPAQPFDALSTMAASVNAPLPSLSLLFIGLLGAKLFGLLILAHMGMHTVWRWWLNVLALLPFMLFTVLQVVLMWQILSGLQTHLLSEAQPVLAASVQWLAWGTCLWVSLCSFVVLAKLCGWLSIFAKVLQARAKQANLSAR